MVPAYLKDVKPKKTVYSANLVKLANWFIGTGKLRYRHTEYTELTDLYLKSMMGHSHKTCSRILPQMFLVLRKINADPIPKAAVRIKYNIPAARLNFQTKKAIGT
jgi:hypothetical protein